MMVVELLTERAKHTNEDGLDISIKSLPKGSVWHYRDVPRCHPKTIRTRKVIKY